MRWVEAVARNFAKASRIGGESTRSSRFGCAWNRTSRTTSAQSKRFLHGSDRGIHHHYRPRVLKKRRRRLVDCLKCMNLEKTLAIRLNDYVEARSSAYYGVCTELAATKKVDMERVRYDLEEHHLVCASYCPCGLSTFPLNKAPRPVIGWNGVSFPLRALLFAVFFLCFAPSGVVALSKGAPNQGPKTRADIGARLITIMGTVQEDGEKLRFVTEQRAWKVDNPEILKGHEGHYVHAAAYIYPDKNLIHIMEVKIPTVRETREADIK
jgi:hypothetical protein